MTLLEWAKKFCQSMLLKKIREGYLQPGSALMAETLLHIVLRAAGGAIFHGGGLLLDHRFIPLIDPLRPPEDFDSLLLSYPCSHRIPDRMRLP